MMNMYQHLKDRRLELRRYDGIYVSDEHVTFTLWNLSGMMVGYQQYNPLANKEKRNHPREGRYFTYLSGDKKNKMTGVWGLESLSYRDDILVICEGIFDACRFHNFNIPAVALLSSSYKPYKNWLTSLGRKIYKVEDDHGSSLGPYEQLKIPDEYADAGEMNDSDIKKMLGVLYEIQ